MKTKPNSGGVGCQEGRGMESWEEESLLPASASRSVASILETWSLWVRQFLLK